MTKSQLVESVAGDTGLDKSEVERTLESILERAANVRIPEEGERDSGGNVKSVPGSR